MTTMMNFHLGTLFLGVLPPFRLLYRYIGIGNMIIIGCYFVIPCMLV